MASPKGCSDLPGQESGELQQGSVNHTGQRLPLPVFINKVLLEHSHGHVLVYRLSMFMLQWQ